MLATKNKGLNEYVIYEQVELPSYFIGSCYFLLRYKFNRILADQARCTLTLR